MLEIISSYKELNFDALMAVYEERIQENGTNQYRNASKNQQFLFAEQDFCDFLADFFKEYQGIYAVWTLDHQYVSAVRFEPYKDGVLLEGLETKPAERGKGYATALINAALKTLQQQGVTKVYSHVSKDNAASMAVHSACGFNIIKDCAVYIDGSVTQNSFTLSRTLKE